MFCNHGLADTWEWLLLWPWDPKLDNFRIGEHTFSEGAGGLKPKTVYRSTFNIGKLSLANAEARLAVLTCVPRVCALRSVLRTALASYLPGLVAEIQRSAHVYSGSALKGDGNYKAPQRIKGGGKCCFHSCAVKVFEAKQLCFRCG